jgi:hypothetical protein
VRALLLLVVGLLAGCVGPLRSPFQSTPTVNPDSPYRLSREEFLLQTKACLETRGYTVEVDLEESSLDFTLGNDQRQADAQAALQDCQREIDPARLEPPPPLSAEQLREWYQFVLNEVECLQIAGYELADVPPEQVFVDTEAAWDPYQALIDTGNAAPPDVISSCQQVEGRPAFLDW